MVMPFPVVALVAVSALSLFLSVLNLSFWRIDPKDRTPLWLSVWLACSVVFTVGRMSQSLPLDPSAYDPIARIVVTSAYALAWVGYELANSLIAYRPRRAERLAIIGLASVSVLLLWTTQSLATHQVIVRRLALGSQFHGLMPGPLYLPANLLLLAIGTIGPIRLLRASGPNRAHNRLIAAGYVLVLFCAIVDILSIGLGLRWPRLLDFSYLPMAVFFTYIQVDRLGGLYRDMDLAVRSRTAELARANEGLRAEVAERRQAQEALQVSEGLYRLLFDSNPHPGWVFDSQTLAFLLVNDAAVAHYGYSRDEFLHMTIEDIRPAEDLPAFREHLAALHDDLRWSGPWHHCKKDGTRIAVEVRSHSLLFNGRPARLVMANDITDRLRAEAALQESENKYRTLVESAQDGIAIIQDDRVRYVNPRLAEMRGEPIADILGQPFGAYIQHDARAGVLDFYARRSAGESLPATYETVLMRKDGSRVLAKVTTGTITFAGRPSF